MRPIKFRCWDPNCRKIPPGKMFYEEDTPLPLMFDLLKKDESLVLMQFTGLLDKNGKEIYEGDVLRYNYIVGDDEEDAFRNVLVKFGEHDVEGFHRNIGFCLEDLRADFNLQIEDSWPASVYIEVIGNIYENKNLLK